MPNQNRIFNTVTNLVALPKVSIERIDDKNIFMLKHEQVFVPDFRFEWCTVKDHYRVYIYVASSTSDKKNAGYCICTVGSGLFAAGFCTLYAFLHRHRANNKEAAYAQ